MRTKAFTGVEVKDADQGTVSATFATFNVKDHDGDVTLPGAFDDGAAVKISAYGHSSWGPARGASSVPMLPVGKGTIRTTDNEAILDGQFFLNTTAGRDTFEVVKQMGDLQEWSYGYSTLEASKGEFEGEDVQFLHKQQVFEVSPVLAAAGVGTRTLAAKSRGAKVLDSELEEDLDEAGKARYGNLTTWVYVVDHDPEEGYVIYCVSSQNTPERFLQVSYSLDAAGEPVLADGETEVEQETSYVPTGKARKVQMEIHLNGATIANVAGKSFSAEASHALASVEAFTSRARSLADMRVKEGRVLSAANRERLTSLLASMDSLAETRAEIERLLAESDPQKDAKQLHAAVLREAMQFERIRATV